MAEQDLSTSDLLKELESIKRFLDEDNTQNIPLLTETTQAHNKQANTAQKTKPKTTKKNKMPSSDNPFLPPHIRKQLKGAKPATVEVQGDLLNGFQNEEQKKHDQDIDQQALIDDLITEFLPKIELRLRDRLQQIITHKTDQSTPKA